MVEGGDGGLSRIGDQAVDGLLAINVGLVLEVAAEGVAARLQDNAGDRKGEEQHQKALPAGERVCLGILLLVPTLRNRREGWGTQRVGEPPAGAEAARQPAGK